MKKGLLIATLFFFISTVILSYILLFTGTEVIKNVKDERITVNYPKDIRNLVLEEMRDYLEVIHEIHQGMAENNPQKIANAAHRQGKAFIDDTPARLLKLSPVPCKTMGFKGHDLFQAIEDSARINYKASTTIRQLSNLTTNCITCHRSYKLKH